MAPASPPPPRLVHVITGLNPGGAEAMCVALAVRLARHAHLPWEQGVISLMPEGPLAAPLHAAGIPVIFCGLRRPLQAPLALWRLAEALRFFQPHVIQSWMYHADLLTGLALRLPGIAAHPALVWGLHNGSLDPAVLPRATRWIVRILARASAWMPDAVVSCAEAARTVHQDAGYRPRRWEVIPNGIDTDRFRPDPALRLAARRAWNLPEDVPVLGLAARDHPVKDLPTFARAVATLAQQVPALRCVCCGQGLDAENTRVVSMLREAGILERCVLLGLERDMPRFWNGVDVAISSSRGEALPLGLAEAMACGVPVAATDVGDTAQLLGECGRLAPPGDAAALARAARWVLEHAASLRTPARARILARFSLAACVERYAALYAALSGRSP
ncbi:glycosyltransferase [Megalodesulfovibrio gigas]|uniref:Putative group 1 glycosyl transferase n=1 Tax=Megalodesulfovibrio gigas (strain ATCC 19364 / DSM 1382 / NCIMB 9332 / VKM B-1759) TaxID=1121448 RepID=T2GFY3_MEGG1|nr:glycosyltransferase [Megalodesulfovibrio gigas]AGW14872.1 putative group 1 glycosyl transferase [Megalodesulfovibrio gigas DSM 1382 = ATCC 19364]